MDGRTQEADAPPDRIEAFPRVVPEVEVFAFRAVQHGGGSRQLPWGSAELSLVFDARGIEISGERPAEHSVIPWASVSRVSRGASEAAPGGGSVTVIGIESPGRIMRFSVTSDHRDPIELQALSERVSRWSAAPTSAAVGPGAPGPAPPMPAAGPSSGQRPVSVPSLPTPDDDPPANRLEPGPSGAGTPGPSTGRRTRRIGFLTMALVLMASALGLALSFSGSSAHRTKVASAAPPPTSDQALAGGLMLTTGDLPAGWSVSADRSGVSSSSSPRVQSGEARITRAFARCLGITAAQASVVLGGAATDQTAETSSPLFVGPPLPGEPGFSLELRTAATIVRSHGDEQIDLAVLADPRYPPCAGAAFASETQLGADSTSGRTAQPGPPSVSAVRVPAPQGEQASGLLVAFTVSDRSVSLPVEVETVSVGYDRIEANLQAVAVGGPIPQDALTSPLAVFADRVAGGGPSAAA